MRAPSSRAWQLAFVLPAVLTVTAASGQTRPPQARSFTVDFAALPRASRETSPAPELLRQVKLRPYGGASVAAWRASPRGVLSVQLEARSPWAPIDTGASGAQLESLSDTCVPPDYPWKKVPVRWGSLSRQDSELTMDLLEASFDPRKCALGEARRSSVVAQPILTLADQPLIFAFRGPESLSVLLPRAVGLVADTPLPRLFFGAFVRVDLPIKPGSSSTLIAAFPAGLAPAAKDSPAFEVNVEVMHLDKEPDPRIFLFVKID